MPHPIEILKRIHRLAPGQIATIASHMHETRMQRGDTIDGNSRLRNTSYYIVKGAARAYYTKDGREHTMSFAFDDEYLMTHLVINSEDIPLTITFMEPTDIIFIHNRKMHEIMSDFDNIDFNEGLAFMNVSLLHYNHYLEERVLFSRA